MENLNLIKNKMNIYPDGLTEEEAIEIFGEWMPEVLLALGFREAFEEIVTIH